MEVQSIINMDKREIIKKIQLWDIEIHEFYDPRRFEVLVNHIKNLPLNCENIISIKKFITKFGLSIMLTFRSFYARLSEDELKEHQSNFKYISSYVHAYLENCYFVQLQFFRSVQPNKKHVKIPKKSERQLWFTAVVSQISRVYFTLHQLKKSNDASCWENIVGLRKQFSKLIDDQFQTVTIFQQEYLKELSTLFYADYEIIEKKKKSLYIHHSLPNFDFQGQQIFPKNNGKEKQFFKFQSFIIGEKSHYQDPYDDQYENECINIENHEMPCCHQFFIFNSLYKLRNNQNIEFCQTFYPFSEEAQYRILSNICSFLNSVEGIMFFGIKEINKGQKLVVKGLSLNEDLRKQILNWFSYLKSYFNPQLSNCKVDFIPIKITEKGDFIPGQFVLRIIIIPNDKNDFYSFKWSDKDVFCLRDDEGHVSNLEGISILSAYQKRKEKKKRAYHEGNCKIPAKGKLLYDTQLGFNNFGKSTREFLIFGVKKNDLFELFNFNRLTNSINFFQKGEKNCYLIVNKEEKFDKIYSVLSKLKDIGKFVLPVFKNLKINDEKSIKRAKEQLSQFHLFFTWQEKTLKFTTKIEACSGYLLLRDYEIPCSFSIV